MPTLMHLQDLPLSERPSPLDVFRWHTSEELAAPAGAKHLRLNLRSLDPGRFSYPYHYHSRNEELFVIQQGAAMLRTPAGFQLVQAGDLLVFETGPASAHQLHNHTDAPCVYLDLVVALEGDVCQYPDTGKVLIGDVRLILDGSQARGYYDGEADVAAHWPANTTGGDQ